MTVITTCNYCHEPIEPDEPSIALTVQGDFASDRHGRTAYSIGHYHSLPENPEDGQEAACFWRLHAGIKVMHNAGAALEEIPTITNRAVAARAGTARPGTTPPDG